MGVEDHYEDMRTTVDKGGSNSLKINAYIGLPHLPIRAIADICSLRGQHISKLYQTR